MSEPAKKKGIPGPFVAVGLIALVWIGLQIGPMLGGRESEPASDEPLEQSGAPETAPSVNAPQQQDATVVGETNYALEGGTWSTYHGGPALVGVVDAELGDALEVVWRVQADSGVYFAPVADIDTIFFATNKGAVHALDYEGNEVWKRQFMQEPYRDGRERVERFDAPAAVFESTVIVSAMRGMVYALDAESGDTRWTYDVGGAVLGTANFHPGTSESGDERVFVIEQSEGVLHAIDLASGETLWKTEGVERCDGSPSVKDGAIVFGSCASALHVYSTVDGGLVKEIAFDEDSQVAGGAAIVGDSAYVGTHSGRVFRAGLNAGEVMWFNEDSYDEIFETPAVTQEYVVFSSYDGNIYALNPETGELIWRKETDGIPTSPVIAGDRVVITTDGVLLLLNLATGEELWSYEISDEASSPAIVGGLVVVGSDDGTVTAFRPVAP